MVPGEIPGLVRAKDHVPLAFMKQPVDLPAMLTRESLDQRLCSKHRPLCSGTGPHKSRASLPRVSTRAHPVMYAPGVVHDPTPQTVHDLPTSKMRAVQESDVWEAAEEDAPASSQAGLITKATGAARVVRAAITDETPADGVEVKPAGGTDRRRPKRRRPGWVGVILAVLAAGPGWSELDDRLFGQDTATAMELGELRGRLDEQSNQINAIGLRLSANTAADLESSSNGALEFRHLDANLTALGDNLALLMDASGVPLADRTPITATPDEITERHEKQIKLFRDARARAEREALERVMAESDTVGP